MTRADPHLERNTGERSAASPPLWDRPSRLAGPLDEYRQRLVVRNDVADRAAVLDARTSVARGVVFLSAVALLIVAFNFAAVSPWWMALPAAVFMVLVVVHGRVLGRLAQAQRSIAHYERGMNRLQNRWAGAGATGERYRDPSHSYSGDLDIFGKGSLFELLSTARTRLGEDTLAAWLAAPARADAVCARQQAVKELRMQVDLREEMALLDALVHSDLDQSRLVDWSQQLPQPIAPVYRWLAVVLGFTAMVSLFAWFLGSVGLTPFAIVLTAEMVFAFSLRGHLLQVATTIDKAGVGLGILSQVLEVIERQPFEAPLLRKIRAALDAEFVRPSRRIARLNSLIEYLNNSLKNQFFAPLAFLLGLQVHLIHAIEQWRSAYGRHIPDWLEAVGEFEALCALSGFAYEHPDHPFPEIVEGGPLFETKELGHPLLPAEKCIRNGVSLGSELRLMMVSGSNMSGKSTLLRTVGTNVVLALAGAPVRAASLKMSPLAIGTAMRVQDSLQEGASLFYTSISRLKQVVEMTAGELPLLFLLDEILQGTNSHDRRVGAEAIIQQLVRRGAIGLVTTHDLALTEMVASFTSQAVNVHFEDRLDNGRMTFDYELRPGVVRKSNALELMRMVGLDVAGE